VLDKAFVVGIWRCTVIPGQKGHSIDRPSPNLFLLLGAFEQASESPHPNTFDFSDRAENSNAYVWAVRRIAGALD